MRCDRTGKPGQYPSLTLRRLRAIRQGLVFSLRQLDETADKDAYLTALDWANYQIEQRTK
jgi:hypothetical protein